MINPNESIELLQQAFKTLKVLDKILGSVEVTNLTFKIKKFLDQVEEEMPEIEEETIRETQYEELDSRLQIVESFLDSVQSVASSKKQLS